MNKFIAGLNFFNVVNLVRILGEPLTTTQVCVTYVLALLCSVYFVGYLVDCIKENK